MAPVNKLKTYSASKRTINHSVSAILNLNSVHPKGNAIRRRRQKNYIIKNLPDRLKGPTLLTDDSLQVSLEDTFDKLLKHNRRSNLKTTSDNVSIPSFFNSINISSSEMNQQSLENTEPQVRIIPNQIRPRRTRKGAQSSIPAQRQPLKEHLQVSTIDEFDKLLMPNKPSSFSQVTDQNSELLGGSQSSSHISVSRLKEPSVEGERILESLIIEKEKAYQKDDSSLSYIKIPSVHIRDPFDNSINYSTWSMQQKGNMMSSTPFVPNAKRNNVAISPIDRSSKRLVSSTGRKSVQKSIAVSDTSSFCVSKEVDPVYINLRSRQVFRPDSSMMTDSDGSLHTSQKKSEIENFTSQQMQTESVHASSFTTELKIQNSITALDEGENSIQLSNNSFADVDFITHRRQLIKTSALRNTDTTNMECLHLASTPQKVNNDEEKVAEHTKKKLFVEFIDKSQQSNEDSVNLKVDTKSSNNETSNQDQPDTINCILQKELIVDLTKHDYNNSSRQLVIEKDVSTHHVDFIEKELIVELTTNDYNISRQSAAIHDDDVPSLEIQENIVKKQLIVDLTANDYHNLLSVNHKAAPPDEADAVEKELLVKVVNDHLEFDQQQVISNNCDKDKTDDNMMSYSCSEMPLHYSISSTEDNQSNINDTFDHNVAIKPEKIDMNSSDFIADTDNDDTGNKNSNNHSVVSLSSNESSVLVGFNKGESVLAETSVKIAEQSLDHYSMSNHVEELFKATNNKKMLEEDGVNNSLIDNRASCSRKDLVTKTERRTLVVVAKKSLSNNRQSKCEDEIINKVSDNRKSIKLMVGNDVEDPPALSSSAEVIESSINVEDNHKFEIPMPLPKIPIKAGKLWRRSYSLFKRQTQSLASRNDSGFSRDSNVLSSRRISIRIVPVNSDLMTELRSARDSIMPILETSEENRETVISTCRKSVSDILNSTTHNLTVLEEYAVSSGYVQEAGVELFHQDNLENQFGCLSLRRNSLIDLDHHHHSLTAKEIVLRKCGQTEPLPFAQCYPDKALQNCHKIGEGVYGEVFLMKNPNGGTSVLKVIPIEGALMVNGERQKKFEEILSEIVIATELHNLRHNQSNGTSSYSEVQKIQCVQGSYPPRLLDLWDLYDETKGSENDSPEIFNEDQLYIVLQLGNAGKDLEAYIFRNASQAFSMFQQVACGLAVAEESLKFEHRDLHWGNVLLNTVEDNQIITFHLDGKTINLPARGVEATIIDFTLSRIEDDGVVVYNDLSVDPDLFTADGDYQFEIYRLMQKKNRNDWQIFEPYTNVLWLHYTLDKAITALRYKYRQSKIHKQYIDKMKAIADDILNFKSAKEFVTHYFL